MTGRAGGLRGIVRRYLPELVYGANDGVVTTFAIVAGIVGADLSTRTILILGFASLFADAVSMAASDVLSERSRPGGAVDLATSARHGAATFLGFVVAGVVPLLAYLIPATGIPQFTLAALFAATTLFVVGAARAPFTGRAIWRSGGEMLVIGAAAGAIAWGVGRFIAGLVDGAAI